MRPIFKAVQDQAVIEVFKSREEADQIDDPTPDIKVTENDDNYSSNHFLMDLTDAFDLPNYFGEKEHEDLV